jgi:hypothetical protein
MFFMECAMGLRSAGCEIVFLLDTWQSAYNRVPDASIRSLEQFAEGLRPFGQVLAVTQISPDPSWAPDFTMLVSENAIWNTKGEELADEFLATHIDLLPAYVSHGGLVYAALRQANVDWLLLPGGVFGVSGIYVEAAKSLCLDFTTVDSGPGRFFIAHRGIASQSTDLPEALALLQDSVSRSPALRDHLMRITAEAESDRQYKRDVWDYQNVARSAPPSRPYDVIVFLNYRADTAALLRQKIFSSVRAWVMAVMDWAEKRGGIRVGIRPHPVTRLSRIKSTDALEKLVKSRDPEQKFSEWIPADAPVSSYDLLQTASVVTPYTSTIGIEAAMMGIPVVIGSHCYYENLGFVHAATDQEDYFGALERALTGETVVTESQKEAAALCLYLMMQCRSVHSSFTPAPSEYPVWTAMSPVDLWSTPEARDLLTSMLGRKPLAWIRHLRLHGSQSGF